MAALLGDPQVMRYYPHPKSRDEASGWIAWNQRLYREHGVGLWLLTLREGGAFVGDCGLTPQQVDGVTELEVGYHVRAALQGRGLATGTPERLSLPVLAALCDILQVSPTELIAIRAENVAPRTAAAGGDPQVTVVDLAATLRPKRARVRPEG